MKVKEFIKVLQGYSKQKKELSIVIECPNGELTSPSVKMLWDDPMTMFQTSPDKIIITWKK